MFIQHTGLLSAVELASNKMIKSDFNTHYILIKHFDYMLGQTNVALEQQFDCTVTHILQAYKLPKACGFGLIHN